MRLLSRRSSNLPRMIGAPSSWMSSNGMMKSELIATGPVVLNGVSVLPVEDVEGACLDHGWNGVNLLTFALKDVPLVAWRTM